MSISLRTRRRWVDEAKEALRQTKEDTWRCHEAVDGKILTDKDYKTMVDSGIDPIDINRISPVIGLLSGMQSTNRRDIIAKGRTSKDSQQQSTITEAIKYVFQQNMADYKISAEFQQQLKGGFGYLSVDDNPDPRQESIRINPEPWQNFWYDPFAPDPWLNPETCRYCFKNPWMDLDEFASIFPSREGEIRSQFADFVAMTSDDQINNYFDDEGTKVEERRTDTKFWVNEERRRVRPVEMWYTQFEKVLFAIFPDGSYAELDDKMDWQGQQDLITRAQKIIPANVRRMWVSIFFGEVEVMNERSKLPHDQYKFVPFVGYLDRYGFPYGVPMQLIGLNIEVIKRRSMALALLKSRLVIMEEDAPADDSPRGIDDIHAESQKLDGLIVLKKGAILAGKIKIEERAQLLQGQELMAQACENEIKEISGVNDESQGWNNGDQSGKALQVKIQRSATTTAQMFDNLSRSEKMVGELTVSMIQGRWTGEKVLRVTDSMTGAERFVELNKKYQREDGVLEIKNNITQGRYDLIVSEAQQTDTVRERNLTLLNSWMEQAPDDIKPLLFAIAMEISDLHNKDQIVEKMRASTGRMPGEEDMSPEEVKAVQDRQLEEAKARQEVEQKIKDEAVMLDLKEKQAKIEKLMADAQKIMAEIELKRQEMEIKKESADADNYTKGFKIGKEMRGGDAAYV